MSNLLPPPSRLRCEYLVNPIGVDSPFPRFSWYLKHDKRGEGQFAYQILIASSVENARAERGDVWDSGQRPSPDNFAQSAVGPALTGSTVYYWRVRWWDLHGGVSAYSSVAFFETGVLKPEDWTASWIGPGRTSTFSSRGTTVLGEYTGDVIQSFGVYLRKEFPVKDDVRVRRARAYISGLGLAEFRVNGEKMGGRVLDPAPTDYAKRALYSTKNLTEILQPGLNAVGLILGNGRFIKNYGFGPPKGLVQIEIDYADGTRQTVGTDVTWKTSEGPLQRNGLYCGETYDARLEMPGWDAPRFNDSAWAPAVVREDTPLASAMLPPIRVTQILKPQRLGSPAPGVYVYDLGQNFTGWARLKVVGPAGSTVNLRYAELLNPDGTLNTLPNQNAEARDTYILRGNGTEFYEPRFTSHGFRYVEVTGYPGVPSLDSLEGCFVHTDADPTGEFHCSNEVLNGIHANILWGQRSNLMGIPTDCPQRDERQGWLGDAHLAAEEAMFNFDLPAFYTKFLDDILLAQREDGSLPDVVPPYLGQTYPADPAWGSAYPTIVWLAYQHYGDRRLLERHYPHLKKYVRFLTGASHHNLIDKLGKYGDWCPPGSVAPKRTPLALTSTWFYYHDVMVLSRIAEVLEERDDAHSFLKRAEDIKASFNKAFLGPDGYASLQLSNADKGAGQTSNLLPLHLHMVPDIDRERILRRLVDSVVRDNDHHLDTGIIGTRYLLDVLTENGQVEAAFRVATQETYPGWGYMIAHGATTLWERWENLTGGGMNSHNHIMFGSIDAWLYRVVAGLTCLSPGWARFRVKPYPVDGLTFASARIHTVKGEIHAGWERSPNACQIFAQVPVGAEAEVHIPLLWESSVLFENGILIWEKGMTKAVVPEISFEGQAGDRLVFRIGSGFYAFTLSPVS